MKLIELNIVKFCQMEKNMKLLKKKWDMSSKKELMSHMTILNR